MITFSNIINNNIQYLLSDEFKNREDSKTNIDSVSKLVEINKKGILTIESQIGVKEKYKNYEIYERAYIIGFMMKKKANNLLKKLAISMSDKVMIILPFNKFENLPAINDIPLTIEKNIKNSKSKIITHMSVGITKEQFNFEAKNIGFEKKDYENIVMVFIFDPIWNRFSLDKDGLLTIIVNHL